MLKRAGRGNDLTRKVNETSLGELAVLCPACPCPNINLPDDWESEPKETRFVTGNVNYATYSQPQFQILAYKGV